MIKLERIENPLITSIVEISEKEISLITYAPQGIGEIERHTLPSVVNVEKLIELFEESNFKRVG